MKKLLILILISSCGYAQTEKGSFSFGTGSVSFSREQTDTDRAGYSSISLSTIEVNPGVGYFLVNNLETGISLHYIHSKETVTSISNNKRIYKRYSLTPMPYVMYYFGKSRFKPFIAIRGGIRISDYYITDTPPRSGNYTDTIWDFSGGAKYFINKNLALGLNIGWGIIHSKAFHSSPQTNLTAGINFNMYLPTKREKKTD